MTLKCKINFHSYGFLETKEIPILIEKDREYTLEKQYDERMKLYYYNVIVEDKVLTTISESDLNVFFEIN